MSGCEAWSRRGLVWWKRWWLRPVSVTGGREVLVLVGRNLMNIQVLCIF